MFEGPRAAIVGELPEIVKLVSWMFGFDRYGISIDKVFPHVFCEENVENLRVITCDSRIVSHLSIWEGWLYFYGIRFKVGLIGCVCTHPDYRMRGYASMLVSDALAKLRRDGADIVMVSGARTLYSRAGCVESGILYDYRITADTIKLITDCRDILEVEAYTKDKILDLIELYQREPIRFRRSYEEFKILVDRIFTAGVEAEGYASILLAYRMGKPVSYVALLRWPGSDLATVIEYAGSRTAILRMLYDAFRILNVERMRLQVPYGDWDLVTLLEGYGLKPKSSYAPASFAIIDPVRFVEKIEPYIEDRIGVNVGFKAVSCDDCIELYISGETMRIEDPRKLTAILFGRPSVVHNLRDGIHVDMEAIPKVFRRILPLPSISYGLNYI
ncbi:MAG: GNAT family N-acetyltransferase [Candidatus Bathyarchaeota archaeon]|nr:GNAT family N-acetyltransferase [Candidatus Bathyarchaeota archaeon]